MADIEIQLAATHAATRDTRQTQQQSAVPRLGRGAARHGPPPTAGPPLRAPAPVAFDVLLAAQQARTPERGRDVDVRGAYGDTPQKTKDQGDTGDTRVFSEPNGAQTATTPPPAQLDNVISLFAPPLLDTVDTPSRPEDTVGRADRRQANQAQTNQARASRAYVNAGAFDGRAFATAGLDGFFRPEGQSFDILA